MKLDYTGSIVDAAMIGVFDAGPVCFRNRRVGLIINFNVVHLRDGIKRLVNHFSAASSVVVG